MAEKAPHQGDSCARGKRALASLLSDYFRDTAALVGREDNRFTFLLVGAGLVFIVLSYLVGTACVPKDMRWLLPLPGTLVVLLAFLDRFRRASGGHLCLSGFPEELRPCKEIQAVWPERRTAEGDIRESLLKCETAVFVAGACLNTLRDVFVQDDVLKHLARALAVNTGFTITILMLRSVDDYASSEAGRRKLPANLASGHKMLRRFTSKLRRSLPSDFARVAVQFGTYDQHAFPRHFLCQVDDTIYAGSYLCHEEGAYSYLLRLANRHVHGGLYELFAEEVAYLREHSEPFDIMQGDAD